MLPKLFQFFCVTIVTLIGFLPRAVAQDFNPQPLLDSIQVKFGGVKDYSADINIKVNVSFLKIPVKEGKLYFKNPDQLKLVSKGFAMLPKRGMNFTFNELFEKKYNVIYVKNELINKVKSYVIKIIPLDDNSDILLATLWLDRKTQTIIKVDAVSVTGNFDAEKKAKSKDNKPERATLTIGYSNYIVNRGISDAFFKEDKHNGQK